MSARVPRLSVVALFLVAFSAALVSAAESAPGNGAAVTISDFRAPFPTVYGDWKDKVQVAGGHAVLKDLGTKGGTVTLVNLDLSAHRAMVPVLYVKTTSANTAQMMQLQLGDSSNCIGTWQYVLPKPSADFVAISPQGAYDLANPDTLYRDGKPAEGPLDLKHLVLYQLQGDWQQGVLDLEIASVGLIAADARMDAERKAAQTQRSENLPEVTHVSLVAPDILSLSIASQHIVPATITRYVPQPGDEKKEKKWPDGVVSMAELYRSGKFIGRLEGKDLDWLLVNERLAGDPLMESLADDPANFTITSKDDPAFSAGFKPSSISRKSVPFNTALPGDQHASRHHVYLKLPAKIQDGKTYTIHIAKLNVKNRDMTFKANLPAVRSDAVHVSQIGYRPDDPVKRGFLSTWLGTGGAYSYPENLPFSLIDDATNKVVLTGKIECVMAADGTEQLWVKPPQNYSKTAVYRMDFSSFSTPGTYRIYVEGIGCSYPFEIGKSVWEKAFLVQMKGLYNQRSGVELGPPYTAFKKPRDFHPDDGVVVTRTKFDSGDPSPHAIAKLDTGEVIKNAWGGYHDAGDWNPRRVTHMYTTLAQLEVHDLYPAYFRTLKLNIPPMDGVPDTITEALFEIDCFRRLQLPDGGIPWGIETDGDPGAGEVSWLSTMHCYVLAPTMRDSWLYAAVAGRAAKVLKPIKPELAQVYQDSATRAFAWAEAEYARMRAAGKSVDTSKSPGWNAFDVRNLSSLVLYDIMGDQKYHTIFLENTCLKNQGYALNAQADAVFLYARMDEARTDPKIREAARAGVIKQAEDSLQYASGNAFNLTHREKGRPMFAGFFSTAGGTELVRAHYLTGKREYLAGAVQSCQFQSGCNPNNLVYTTGLGSNPVQAPLDVDARSSGQPNPIGLTVFGNSDYFNWPNSFWDVNVKWVSTPRLLWPDAYQWPLTEAYFDCWILVSANEFVIDTWAPNVLVWGYLAARP